MRNAIKRARAEIARAASPSIVAMSLGLIGLATYGAIPAPEPVVWHLGTADIGLWI